MVMNVCLAIMYVMDGPDVLMAVMNGIVVCDENIFYYQTFSFDLNRVFLTKYIFDLFL